MNLKNRSVLVTGGTGFVGANLARELKYRKNKVIVFSDRETHPFLKGLDIEIKTGDIRNYDAVLNAVKGCDYVFHLAATAANTIRQKDNIFGINVDGTENVMKACLESNVKKVVYASSSATLGFSRRERKLTEKDVMDSKDNLYGQSKKLGEDKVYWYISKGLDATVVIPSFVMGAGEIDPTRYGLFRSISRGRIRLAFPGGSSMVAVEDLIEGMILAMENGKTGERYILSSNYLRLFNFYNLIAKIMGKPRIKFCIPHGFCYPMYFLGAILQVIMKNPPISTESVRWHFNYKFCDSSKARTQLGWTPKVSLEESIKRAMDYYKSIGVLN